MHAWLCSFQGKQIELVDGYGVYLTKRQLDEAMDQSCNSPTRLVRNLLMVFFPPNVLAASSCYGNRKLPALNKDIVSACISKLHNSDQYHLHIITLYHLEYTQTVHPTCMRSIIVDAINDKCANYRRRSRTVGQTQNK